MHADRVARHVMQLKPGALMACAPETTTLKQIK